MLLIGCTTSTETTYLPIYPTVVSVVFLYARLSTLNFLFFIRFCCHEFLPLANNNKLRKPSSLGTLHPPSPPVMCFFFTLGRHRYCRWSLRPSVRPSVRPERRCRSNSFKDFRYQPEIWRDDAQYHGADRYLKWLCSANFCAFHGKSKFSMLGLGQVWGTMLPLELLNDFSYWSEKWHDAQYHEAGRCLKLPCSAIFSAFHGTVKFPE